MLIGYVKMIIVKDELNEYTYTLFISSTTILNVIHIMILLYTYQYFHRIHCHSASIVMDSTTSGTKCQFGCHGWCWNIQNISCYSCKNQILSTITFSST